METNISDFVDQTNATSNNLHIERIRYDKVYFDNNLYKSDFFFKQVIVKELYTSVVKHQ